MANRHEQDNLCVLAEYHLKGYTAAGASPPAPTPAPQAKAPVQYVYEDRWFGLPVGLHIFKALKEKLTKLQTSLKTEYADSVKDCRTLGLLQATWVTRVDDMLALFDLSRAIKTTFGSERMYYLGGKAETMQLRSEFIRQMMAEAFESLRWYNPTKPDRVALRARLITAFEQCSILAEEHRIWCHQIQLRSDMRPRISSDSDKPNVTTKLEQLYDDWQNCDFSLALATWKVKGVPSISLDQRVLICALNGATTEDEFAQLEYSEMKLPAVNLKALQHITNSYRTKHKMPLLVLSP